MDADESTASRRTQASQAHRRSLAKRSQNAHLAMGQTNSTGTQCRRVASCTRHGNVGHAAEAPYFRGHTNVQGATDLGLDVTTCLLLRSFRRGVQLVPGVVGRHRLDASRFANKT